MDLLGLETLLALGNFELDAHPVVETFISVHFNCGEVDEYVLPTVHRDEAVALFAVEPLDGAMCHCALPYYAVLLIAVAKSPAAAQEPADLDVRRAMWRPI